MISILKDRVKLNYEDALNECRKVLAVANIVLIKDTLADRYNNLGKKELNKYFNNDQITKTKSGCDVDAMDIGHLHANIRAFSGLPDASKYMPLGPYIPLQDRLKCLRDARNDYEHTKHTESYDKYEFDTKLDDLQTHCTEILKELKNKCNEPVYISLINMRIVDTENKFKSLKDTLSDELEQKAKEIVHCVIPPLITHQKGLINASKEASTLITEQTVERGNLAERMTSMEQKLEAVASIEKKLESMASIEQKLDSMACIEQKLESMASIEEKLEAVQFTMAQKSPLTRQRGRYKRKGCPTLERFEPFDPSRDAAILRSAMKGRGTNEDAIIGLFSKRTADQRNEILKMYNTVYKDRDCMKDLKDELSGDFKKAVVALTKPLPQFLAQELHRAMDGPGTDERTLIEILCSVNNQWILEIKNAYQAEYKKLLVDDIKGDTSGDFRKLLIAICEGKRDEKQNSDPSLAKSIAETLYKAGEGRRGTDESEYIKIMTNYSYPLLKTVFEEYRKIGGNDFSNAIDSELSGDFKKGVKAIYDVVINCPAFFAKELYESMKGLGTRDSTLIRLVIVRSEIDMKDIKREFLNLYKKKLERMIKGDTSGDYRKLLLALVEG